MELTPKQQTIELVRAAQKVLIFSHINPDGDALGSMLALALVLKKLGKEVTAVTSENLPENLQFLPCADHLSPTFSSTKDFIIAVNTSRIKVDKLSYKNLTDENKLNIIITPTNGLFKPEDVTFSFGQYKYDLIIVLDSPDLERLGELYDKSTELFYETPVINIDHHPGNDHFGKVNWVDLTATSTAEILVALIESLGRDKPLLDNDIATALLTGIIVDTGSFQNSNTTPKSFTVAAQLVAAGARQQEIIKWIFRTRTLSTLKLWGRVLENIKEEKESRFIWSSVSRNDFDQIQANDSATSGVLDELLKTAPGIDFALLLSEKNDGLHGSFRSAKAGVDVSAIARLFGGGGHEAAAAFNIVGESLNSRGNDVIAKIRDWQSKKIV